MNKVNGIEVREANETELKIIDWASDYNTFCDYNVRDDMECEYSLENDDVWYVDESTHTAYCCFSSRHSSNGMWIHVRELRYDRFIHVATTL